AFWVLAKHAGAWDLLRLAPGWLLYEFWKALQALTVKPWLLRAQVERLAGLRAMARRRRALRLTEGGGPKRTSGALQAIEMNLRDAQAPAYDALTGGPYHEAVESAACLERLAAGPGERIVDLGCGTGRLLPALVARGARVFGADFSLASLKIARQKAPGAVLVQADLTRLPFKPGVFDRAVSHHVLHHLPDAAGRRKVLGEAARTLRKEGEIVLTCYNDALLKRLLSPREERHPGGIFYHRFRPGELRRLFEGCFDILEDTGIRHIPARSIGERLFTRPGFRWLPALDRRLERSRISRLLAHLWLVRARVRSGAQTTGCGGGEVNP
ncbi:MAG: class I SAM-dependent methyltransferase, partial [Myxococcota bacterium]